MFIVSLTSTGIVRKALLEARGRIDFTDLLAGMVGTKKLYEINHQSTKQQGQGFLGT